MDNIKEQIENNDIVIIKKDNCINCKKLYDLLNSFLLKNISFVNISELDDEYFYDILEFIERLNPKKELPMLFIKNEYIGNYEKIKSINEFGLLSKLLEKKLDIKIDDEEDF